MHRVPFAGLVRPGCTSRVRDLLDALAGQRRDEYRESRRRAGITRECVWIVATPVGDVVVGFVESDDSGAMSSLGYSDESFDVWFAEQVREVFVDDESGIVYPDARDRIYAFEWLEDPDTPGRASL